MAGIALKISVYVKQGIKENFAKMRNVLMIAMVMGYARIRNVYV